MENCKSTTAIEIIIISLQYSIGIRQRAQNPAAARIKHEMIPLAITDPSLMRNFHS